MVVGKDYVKFVKDTFKLQGTDDAGDYLVLGLLSEVGEVADVFKKALHEGKPLNKKELILELGDLAWFSTALALEVRTPSQVAVILDTFKVEDHDQNVIQKAISTKDFLIIYEILRDLEDNSSVMASPAKFRKRLEIIKSFAATLNVDFSNILQGNIDKLKTREKVGKR